jgi:hypothetical protein
MAKKITIVGAKPRKLEIVDRPRRRIDPAELGAAIDAEPCGRLGTRSIDPLTLAELGTQLLQRLRSSGGRPALADATVNCRVPLSEADVKTLENMVSEIGTSTGAKPSVGQLVSAIVRMHLNESQGGSRTSLQRLLDEQLHPLREQLKRLESEIHAATT